MILPTRKDKYLPRIVCSENYKQLVRAKKKELKITYTDMIRYAFEETWGIPHE